LKYSFLLLTTFACVLSGTAQYKKDSLSASLLQKENSGETLEAVVIRGFESKSSLSLTPASIGVISSTFHPLNATSSLSLLPAFNQLSGVRFEERSPGSFRLSVRGSLLRSPFGVRNIKMYLDDFIFSDAGGNTYLNLLDINSIGGAEVLKGPAGSLYGAGTGGAVLLNTANLLRNVDSDSIALKLTMNGGRFGAFNQGLQFQQNNKHVSYSLIQGHAQADGYRDQSRMRKDNILFRMSLKGNEKVQTEMLMMYTDLYYQTPGGLTLAQFLSNPRQSRPGTATIPSVKDQKTAVYNKTAILGLANTVQLNENWKTVSSFSTSLTGFKNPFLTNYEKRDELNIGLRSKWVYENSKGFPFQWVSGVEVQKGEYSIDSSGNNRGIPDQNKINDEVMSMQQFVFSQVSVSPAQFIHLQAGFSYNAFQYSIERKIGTPSRGKVPVKFNGQFLPRVSVMVNPVKGLGIYGVLSKGYSSPSVAEIRPSAGGIYEGLQAEYGWNKEWGIKLNLFRGRFTWELFNFQFDLKDAIVRQVNAAGAEYFINSGSTRQKGWETDLSLLLFNRPMAMGFNKWMITGAYTRNHFRFLQYKTAASDLSDKKITGVPSDVFSCGMQTSFLKSFFLNTNFNYAGSMPLNDLNTFFADPYRLWQAKIGWDKKLGRKQLVIYLLIDNIADERFSLGNDINAFGGRFYNAAPSRNIQAGFSIRF
jgi:iron complex outermembrane receptor protein